MRCEQCEVLMINGTRCHEQGCPDAWKDYTRECKWCSTAFTPEEKWQQCCDHECQISWNM